MPRVLMIRYEGYPFMIRMSKVIMTLLAAGWECDLLIPRQRIGSNVSKEMGHDVALRVRLFEFTSDHSFSTHCHHWLYGKHGVVHDPAFAAELLKQLRSEQYDLLWVKDTHCLPLVFSCLDQLGDPGLRVVCDIYENAPAQLHDQYVSFGNVGLRLLYTLRQMRKRLVNAESAFLPRCDHIFVVIEEMKEHLIQAYGLDPARIGVIHNVELLAAFDAAAPTPFAIPPGTLCTYIGGFESHRGLPILLDAVTRIAKMPHPQFILTLVGATQRKKRFYEEVCVQKKICDLVTLVDFCTYSTALHWFKQSYLGLIPHLNTEQIRTTIPNKFFQYMAAGVGSLVADVGPLGRIARETGCAMTYSPDNSRDLADKLLFALEHPEFVRDCGKRGRQAVETRYCWEIECKQYTDYLQWY